MRTTTRRTTTANEPSGARSCSSRTTWARMTARGSARPTCGIRDSLPGGGGAPRLRCASDHRPPVDRPGRHGRAARRAPRRRPRVDADQPRPAVSRRTSRSRAPPRRPSWTPGQRRRRSRSARGTDPRRARPACPRGAGEGAGGHRREGGPAEPRGGAVGRGLGGDDRVGDDDRGGRGGHSRLRDGRHRRRPSRGGDELRHLVGSRRAGPDAGRRRLRRAQSRSSTCRRRSSTSRRAECRS